MNEVTKIISQLEHQKAAIERAISALREIDGPHAAAQTKAHHAAPVAAAAPHHKKRRLSAEGRKRIADAARKRWAEIRAKQGAGAKKKGS